MTQLKKDCFCKNIKQISLPSSFWANASSSGNKTSESPNLTFFV